MDASQRTNLEKPEDGSQEKLLEELIFKQDLNEVHLLIDVVSGRADRSLRTLSMSDPQDRTKILGTGEVIQAIAEMRYPPDGTKAANARNAAILLVAKDQLSALATPANGLSIAYTRMFIDEEAGALRWSSLPRWLKRGQKPSRPHDTRTDLAQRSFPGLRAHARKFRLWRDGLVLFALFWLVLTALAYWDAGLGRAALERLDQDWKLTAGELNDNPALIRCAPRASAQGNPGAATSAEPAGGDADRKQLACGKYKYHLAAAKTAGQQVNAVFRCENMDVSTRLVHVWCWEWLLSGTAQPASATAASGDITDVARANVAYWQTASSILSVFTTYILPMMFALLGTLIGAFRAILNRIAANELAPRDLVRMKIGVPTGLVAGIAVGLFLSPSSVPMYGSGGVAGQFTLTACGLGFLAGYASQSFFNYLDNLLGTVFPTAIASRDNAVPSAAIPQPDPPRPATAVPAPAAVPALATAPAHS